MLSDRWEYYLASEFFLTPKWATESQHFSQARRKRRVKTLLFKSSGIKKICLFLEEEAFQPPSCPLPPSGFGMYFRGNPSLSFHLLVRKNSGLPAACLGCSKPEAATLLSICWSQQHTGRMNRQQAAASHKPLLCTPQAPFPAHPPLQACRTCTCGSRDLFQFSGEEPCQPGGEDESNVYQHITHHKLGKFI